MVPLLLLYLGAAERQCDVIELNHHLCDGQVRYSQVIYWRWEPDYNRYDVAGYRMCSPDEYPVLVRGKWKDRGIVAPTFKETTSTLDPEAANRRLRDLRDRTELR